MSAPFLDLASYLHSLEGSRRLRRVRAAVDKDTELAAIARWAMEGFGADGAYAILFENVRGNAAPVAVHLYATPGMYAAALGTALPDVLECWSRALAEPRPSLQVERAPVHEVVQVAGDADLHSLPVPVWTPGRDAGPYLSAAMVVTRDPQTGIQNLGNYRVQIHAPQRAGLFFGSRRQHGAMHLAKYRQRGEAMPVALVVGAAPVVNFAAAAKTAFGIDEITIAGGLAGAPLEVVRCRTVDLLVPARAEVVIEGLVPPDAMMREGPFGEALGYMEEAAPAPYLDVTAICHRRDAIHHGYVQQLPPSDGHLVMEMGVLGPLWHYLTRKLRLRGLRDLAVGRGSAGVASLIVQLGRSRDRDAGMVGRTLARLNFGQKFIYLVDDDIDIRDPEAVNWAVSSRVDPDRDITLRSNTPTFQSDPSTRDRARARGISAAGPPYESSLAIIDATLKGPSPAACLPERRLMERVLERWAEWGLPPLAPRLRLQTLLQGTDEAARAPG